MQTEAETLDELRRMLDMAQGLIDDAQTIITLQANGKGWEATKGHPPEPSAEAITNSIAAMAPVWHQPTLVPFTDADWMSYPGCEYESPLIAPFRMEGVDVEMVVEPHCVGIYGVRLIEPDNDEIISYSRHWREDDFTTHLDIGRKFADMFLDGLAPATTFDDLKEWGFKNDM